MESKYWSILILSLWGDFTIFLLAILNAHIETTVIIYEHICLSSEDLNASSDEAFEIPYIIIYIRVMFTWVCHAVIDQIVLFWVETVVL